MWLQRSLCTADMSVNGYTILESHLVTLHIVYAWIEQLEILLLHVYAKEILSRAWWLTSEIQALWEAEMGRLPEVRSSTTAWLTWRNPISTKNTKLAGCGGTRLQSQPFGRLRRAGHLMSGVRDQSGKYAETPSLLKNTKISWAWLVGACNLSYLGGWGSRITWTSEAEVAVSWDCAIAL